MDVVVQRVCTTWSKRARGGSLAAARNAAAVAFELPAERAPLFHDVVQDEEDDFVPRARVLFECPPPASFGLRLVGGSLRVRLPDGFGAPVRAHRPVVMVGPGEWLRWQTNNRYSSSTGMAGWHYNLVTVNIAFGAVPRDTFLGRPAHLIDERAALR
ncbi:hypothetical protein O7635_10385 [Asanoa sp. WMMD1127]|uniref:hypothetical protein n=1 Tax=Asanoa sp. WMMD1127 TaxID=3016107 RepID=UPI002415EF69|nr:hypothetical protein [Asanoa sp. WMMD1127]MDG4822257.1 hypothetical protein [Asanoa sp. WMMD1127]